MQVHSPGRLSVACKLTLPFGCASIVVVVVAAAAAVVALRNDDLNNKPAQRKMHQI